MKLEVKPNVNYGIQSTINMFNKDLSQIKIELPILISKKSTITKSPFSNIIGVQRREVSQKKRINELKSLLDDTVENNTGQH